MAEEYPSKYICDIGLISGNTITVFGQTHEIDQSLKAYQGSFYSSVEFKAVMISGKSTNISINPTHVEFIGRTREYTPPKPEEPTVNGNPLAVVEDNPRGEPERTLIIGEESK